MSDNPEADRKIGKRPTHIAKHARKFKTDGKEKNYWTECGVAWANSDGSRISVQLHVVPLDGNIVLWLRDDK